MKLQCQVEVVNRLHNALNVRKSGKYLKSTLAIGKEPKSETEYFILYFSSVNKTGTKYRVKSIKQVFVKCLNEGRMPNLSELYLSNNKLGAQKDINWKWLFGPQITKSLKLLDLSSNQLTQLPKPIWKLQKLVTLKLDNNQLEKLPGPLGRIGTLRYLTISRNTLASLPCSLMQCNLEYLDISSNNFNHSLENPELKQHSPWDFYVGSLVHLSSKVVLKHKMFYAPNIIPWTLVEFLDNANMCVCGMPVVNDMYFRNKEYELKDFFRVVVFDNNRSSTVAFECYYCSPRCFSR
ncbi:leucine-rich repeat protein 1 isoform X2 [Leguminivora glycinivorella]|uniref:leucine-rich repeat protein 1 isoform X2 n=1 Tax=Leguminivora glycinivorella TaxID=1035111 RepID=UPI00200D1C87|nr:leucine-rich repeat protein 1 isoform X2 [Leguminivora glycinivorella]